MISYYFILFIFGGACHLPSFKQCSGDLVFLCEQLAYYCYRGKKIQLYYKLVNIVNIEILTEFLLQNYIALTSSSHIIT